MQRILTFAAIVATSLTVAGPGTASQADPDPRYAMGARICGQILDGKLGGFNASYYRQRVSTGPLERHGFCHCVGTEFADDADDRFGLSKADGEQAAKAMTAKITDALETCNSADGDLADGEDTSDPYEAEGTLPDYKPADPRLPIDESDRDMCRMAMDGNMPIPGFDEEAVKRRLQRTGQSAADLCACSARKMTARSGELEKEMENAPNPSVVYSSTLGGSINTCLR